eukprot:CAMPEP_0195113518 /NCGR_PEP_ID=MMETSP0448-20130528/102798_1 /TAXON_ID=66468 /ORGANISM="Heterocapsa triquestra, Strain CCMP 448" /LENGTH=62 /DNA_ID=CAMNT_0040150465 /DNA_START=45 /DNA_END=229 /DNA_ORIENTATION=-
MTGVQLWRLGRRGLTSLCSDIATADALWQALLEERAAARNACTSNAERNAMMAALGTNKAHV